MIPFRIGQGFDVHAFDDGSHGADSHVMLGGVRIPHARGILAQTQKSDPVRRQPYQPGDARDEPEEAAEDAREGREEHGAQPI